VAEEGPGLWADANAGSRCGVGSEYGWHWFHCTASRRGHQQVKVGIAALAHHDDPEGFHPALGTSEFHSIVDPKVPDRGSLSDTCHLGVQPMPPEHSADLSSTNAPMSDQQYRLAVALGHAGYCNCMPPMVPPRPAITDIAQCPAQSADCCTEHFRRLMERQGVEAHGMTFGVDP
jgi:hypothetical protein